NDTRKKKAVKEIHQSWPKRPPVILPQPKDLRLPAPLILQSFVTFVSAYGIVSIANPVNAHSPILS
ncbi:MAG: hypothetical protein ACE5HC_14710, partial [Candidatus Binatia bacterium]